LEDLFQFTSIADLFLSKEEEFQKLFAFILKELLVVKAQVVLFLTLGKIGTSITQEVYLHGFSSPFTHISNLGTFLYSQASDMIFIVNNYSELGSRWVIIKYNSIIVNFAQYRSIKGSGFTIERESLTAIEVFFSTLSQEKCSEELYNTACVVYRRFKCKSLLDFLNVYNILDATLLADVLAYQKKMAEAHFKMDMFRFVSSPSFVFHAAIESATINLEFVRDIQIHQMVRQSIRGGIVNVTTRWAKANIPGTKDFNKLDKESHLIFLDFTGLYSSQMLEPLPVGGYKYFAKEELETFDVNLLQENHGLGWLVCCDIEIPSHLHDFFDDLSPLADKIVLDSHNLSSYQKLD